MAKDLGVACTFQWIGRIEIGGQSLVVGCCRNTCNIVPMPLLASSTLLGQAPLNLKQPGIVFALQFNESLFTILFFKGIFGIKAGIENSNGLAVARKTITVGLVDVCELKRMNAALGLTRAAKREIRNIFILLVGGSLVDLGLIKLRSNA